MDNFEVSKEEYDLIQDIKNNKKIVFNYPLDVFTEEDLDLVKFVVNWILVSSELRQKGKDAIEEYNKKKSEAIVIENPPKCQVFEEDSEKAELLREFFGEIQEENNKNKIFLIISTLIFIAVLSFIISIF